MKLNLLKKRAGARFRYYPNCELSHLISRLMGRKSFTLPQIREMKLSIDIEIFVDTGVVVKIDKTKP